MPQLEAVTKAPKHMIIVEGFNDLWRGLEVLERLADTIDPLPPTPGEAKAPENTPSLAQFLDKTPSNLAAMKEKLGRLTDRIQKAIL